MFTCNLTTISNGFTLIVNVDFGDGSLKQKLTLTDNSISVQHSYSSVGNFTLSASVESSNLFINPIITSKGTNMSQNFT